MTTYDQTYLLGWRVDDSDMFPHTDIREDVSVKCTTVRTRRPVAARSLGFHVVGRNPLFHDYNDNKTVTQGMRARFLRPVPDVDHHMLRRIRGFTRRILRTEFEPLPADADVSTETWLAESSYPEWRRQQIRDAGDPYKVKRRRVKPHRKREPYLAWKHVRGINAPGDAEKEEMGGLFHAIDKAVYKQCGYFMKHKNALEKVKCIREVLGSYAAFIETDHTAFEAHMRRAVAEVIEWQLYRYMVKNLGGREDILERLRPSVIEKQRLSGFNKDLLVKAVADARMSGDLWTSLGNGFTNMIVMRFVAECLCGWKQCVGFVEGDDGLFGVGGPIPSDADFRSVGFEIKLKQTEDLSESGFCQLYSTPSAEPIVDPVKVLIKSGWTQSKRMRGGPGIIKNLSIAKAMSMLALSPSNPVTRSMARWILRCHGTEYEQYYDSDSWWTAQLMANFELDSALSCEPSDAQRQLVARVFHVSVEEQLHIENYFDTKNVITPIDDPVVAAVIDRRFPDCFTFSNMLRTYPAGTDIHLIGC